MEDRIFKIEFNISDDYLDDCFSYFSDDDQCDIEELYADCFFDFHDKKDNYNCLMISNSEDIKTYYNILKKNSVYCKIIDLSDDILNNNINIENKYRNYITTENFLDWEFFIKGVKKWIIKELDIDFVLDRITKVGIDNLSKVEKYFLKTYNGKD